MSTFYFIGGAPRSGKTTVIQELIKHKPILAASTDAIRTVATPSLEELEQMILGLRTMPVIYINLAFSAVPEHPSPLRATAISSTQNPVCNKARCSFS